MRARSSMWLLLGSLSAAGILLWFVIWSGSNPPAVPKIGFQDACEPLLMPENGDADPRFIPLSPWQMARIPTALRFGSPLGSHRGALSYNAQKFWEMNADRGGYHLGDDLNGIGGMNSDLGDPVFAIADGLVVYTGDPSPGWGKTVIIAHRDESGRILQSMSSHLDEIHVARDQLLPRGTKIGTVGTGNDHYPAHLHFELRLARNVHIGGGYSMLHLNHLDPAGTLAEFYAMQSPFPAPPPLATALSDPASWTPMDIRAGEPSAEPTDDH